MANCCAKWRLKSSLQHIASQALQAASQDGGGSLDDKSPLFDLGQVKSGENITKQCLHKVLDTLSTKRIHSWMASVDTLRKNLLDLVVRTIHTETKMAKYATAHNDLADHVQQHIESLESKVI
ncbi:Hypothetical predicted protein [Pelobates cultripes]|uniref:Uncharacterized protein n=1 Tax=Pelobates cultripes TaxID=61616 RepID=A0AAD1VLJ7_PELCU|nr:Hypothetical predicted protein [Pelobates cultripes]